MNWQELWDFVRFWEELTPKTKSGDAAKQALANIRAQVEGLDDKARARMREIARADFEEQEAARADVAGRGAQLLLFVGVVSTGTTIVAASLASPIVWITVLTLIVGGLLLYTCLAAAWLAIRAQQVEVWTRPTIDPAGAPSLHTIEVAEVSETHFAARQNAAVVRNLVAYLRDAQLWARAAVAIIALLAILSVLGAATKGPDAPAPAPSVASPSLAPGSPTSTPSVASPSLAPGSPTSTP